MPIPQSVLDAEAEADRLIAEAAGQETTHPDDEAPIHGEPDPAEAEAVADVPAPEDAVETPEAETVPDPVEADSGLAAQLAEVQEELRKLRAAHDTLKGKTYSEVPRMYNENKELRDTIARLEAQLADKSAQPAAPEAPPMAKAGDILSSLKETVNEDVADKIQLLIDARVAEELARTVQPVAERVEKAEKTALETAQDRYISSLTEKVPDWRDIANDTEYAEFLQREDELTGKKLYDLAGQALSTLNATRMAAFYNRFKAEKGLGKAGGTNGTAKAQVAAPAGAASGKEALISPAGTAKTTAREGGEEKPDYVTTTQMEEFNRNRKYMSEAEEAKMEARIDRAIQNGWILTK